MATVSEIVVLDYLLDAHEALLARLDLLDQFLEVTMHLVAGAIDLFVVVGVPRYQVDGDLEGNEVLPVCACYGPAAGEHHLCVVEAVSALLQEMLDLGEVSGCWAL
jgi:hypothetical protein